MLMMQWKQVKNELPPLHEEILIAILREYSDNSMYCFLAKVKKPFDVNKKFNPNYYEMYGIETNFKELKPEYFWMKLDFPCFEYIK
jgi:hypothetical protein